MKKLKRFLRRLLTGSPTKRIVNSQLQVKRIRKERNEKAQPEDYDSPGLILA